MNKFIKRFMATLLWACCIFSLHAQSRQITGLLNASDCIGLTSTSITFRGTAHGTVSDLDGNYTLPVPKDQAVLMISYIGFPTRQNSVGDNTNSEIGFFNHQYLNMNKKI